MTCPADRQPKETTPHSNSRHGSQGAGTTEFKIEPYEEEMSLRGRGSEAV